MADEFAVRVGPELAGWIRGQGPPTQVFRALLAGGRRGLLAGQIPADPGAGPERIKLWLGRGEMAATRATVHTRDKAAAVRRLFEAGRLRGALPSARAAMPRSFAPLARPILVAPSVRAELPPAPTEGGGNRIYLGGTVGWISPARLVEIRAQLKGPTPEQKLRQFRAGLNPASEPAQLPALPWSARHPQLLANIVACSIPVAVIGLILLMHHARQVRAVVSAPLPTFRTWTPEPATGLGRAIWG